MIWCLVGNCNFQFHVAKVRLSQMNSHTSKSKWTSNWCWCFLHRFMLFSFTRLYLSWGHCGGRDTQRQINCPRLSLPPTSHLLKCATCKIRPCSVGQRDQRGDTGRGQFSLKFSHTDTCVAFSPPIPVCLSLNWPYLCLSNLSLHLFVSDYLSISLFLYQCRHRDVMDRGLHSNYSISLITLSQVGRPINALTQMDPDTLTANALDG